MTRSSGIDAAGDGAMELAMRTGSIQLERPRNEKDITTITHVSASDEDSEDISGVIEATSSTHDDIRGMRRMGKSQQLNRTFRQLSITSFVCLATATWEIGLFVISPGLMNGGRAGLIWSMLWCWVGFAPIYLSMAEMASMAPIAGAQYHWVSEFAPESSQKFLSYVTGWVSTVAWQAGNAMGIFLSGSLIQTIILINNENYAFPAWHGTLLAIACQVMAYVLNVYGSRALPHWQNAFFALHVLAYFAYIIPIWVSAPKTSHSDVWTSFQNDGGWPNMTLAVLVGQLTGIAAEVGIDTTAHMSEEVKNASKAIPRTIIAVYIINFALLFPAVVTICYHVPDLDAALNDLTTYPAIYVLRQSMPTAGITVVLTVIVVLLCASNIDYFAAVTRDLFAFARDKGMPYSRWLGTIHPKKHLPIHAGQLSSLIGALLSLIYIGSPTAFYAITSLSTVSLLMCYTLSVGSILWRRIYLPHTLPPAQFGLGRWGIPCNSLAVVFGSWSFFWSFWPQAVPVTAEGFNWASPIFSTVVIFSLGYYWWRAKDVYVGPVKDVEGR